ncbi:hypothetical protein [Mangrovihabitans endophyticus]|uniref:Uncharacterized protein n=1 Tax=Mangrovihabitans endophyticus TaxID=1751298 RepID=A0A8J3C8E9_9ACTN|nr:hypothetical protein [Mangrovihabitans endophyticus]GGL19602.1 hypothetical protein GCM10012284_62730 [Mangrovihabitans endophyticus]
MRWPALVTAVAVLVVFLAVQRQSTDVSYGRSPAAGDPLPEGSAGELSEATVPSVAEMTRMVAADDVVRLPGSVARWDQARVRSAAGGTPVRILVAPPGLDAAERDRVRDVRNATVRVIGTEVTGGVYQARSDTLAGWRAQMATGDVTNLLVTLIHGIHETTAPADVDALRRRDPTPAELAAVLPDLRRGRTHVAPGATLSRSPAGAARAAFAGRPALFVALPRQPFGTPMPRYGPALARVFPDTPIVVLYGSWVEYTGPQAGDFADVAGASFYGQAGDRLGRYAYPQDAVLPAWLNRVTDIRYAGLFDRPLPYRPFDPLRVALPALPWLFAACVAVFLVLSARTARPGMARPGTGRPGTGRSSMARTGAARPGAARTGAAARLAGLTALAVEMSALSVTAAGAQGREGTRAGAPLTRGMSRLTAAGEALSGWLPDRHVQDLLDDAEADLDEAARALPFAGFRPAAYLAAHDDPAGAGR